MSGRVWKLVCHRPELPPASCKGESTRGYFHIEGVSSSEQEIYPPTEDCKLVVTCKMQNRNATDKLNQQCSKLALFTNEICGRITML